MFLKKTITQISRQKPYIIDFFGWAIGIASFLTKMDKFIGCFQNSSLTNYLEYKH